VPVPTARLTATFVARWAPLTTYELGAKVVSPSGVTVTAKAAFTSGATYSAANWNLPADLTAKANDSEVIKTTGAQSATGRKTFTDGLTVGLGEIIQYSGVDES